MSRSVSSTMLQAMFAQETGEVIVALITPARLLGRCECD